MVNYKDIRPLTKPGDLILFSGDGFLSWLIRRATNSNISHAGIITFSDDKTRVLVTDSTQLKGRKGVSTRYLSETVEDYNGIVYWLPLHSSIRNKMDLNVLKDYLTIMQGKKYDFWQVTRVGINVVTHIPFPIKEDYSRVFCSEFVAFALKLSGAYNFKNPSKITPAMLPTYPIFTGNYYQLNGEKDIKIKNYAISNTGKTEPSSLSKSS